MIRVGGRHPVPELGSSDKVQSFLSGLGGSRSSLVRLCLIMWAARTHDDPCYLSELHMRLAVRTCPQLSSHLKLKRRCRDGQRSCTTCSPLDAKLMFAIEHNPAQPT